MANSSKENRTRRWSTDEDMCLCKSIKFQAVDGVIVHQTEEEFFWSWTNALFYDMGNSHYIRLNRELERRFDVIKDHVLKYVECQRSIYEDLPTAMSATEVEIQARQDYELEYAKIWDYEHCFQVLKDLQEFNPLM